MLSVQQSLIRFVAHQFGLTSFISYGFLFFRSKSRNRDRCHKIGRNVVYDRGVHALFEQNLSYSLRRKEGINVVGINF